MAVNRSTEEPAEPVEPSAGQTPGAMQAATSEAARPADPAERAETWVCWETTLISAVQYASPLADVAVEAVFSMPGEEGIPVLAYWDGGLEFKLRCAFPRAGEWTYRTVCSDPGNWGLHGQTGRVRVAPYEGANPLYRHGFLQADESGRYLRHADGTPFLFLGDTVWSAFFRASADEWRRYIGDRADKRFTVVQVSLNWSGEEGRTCDAEGREAQLGRDRWNPAFFRGVDEKIRHANDRGLVVLLNGLHKLNKRGT